MKNIIGTTSIFIASIFLSSTAYSLQNREYGEYTLIALNDCEVVLEQAMSSEQILAYQALEQKEHLMAEAEAPIKGIEDQIEAYAAEIEHWAKQAIQETDDSLFIDNVLLKEQSAAAAKLENLMNAHAADFAHLEKMAEQISNKAQNFEASITNTLAKVEHDSVRIVKPGNTFDLNCPSLM